MITGLPRAATTTSRVLVATRVPSAARQREPVHVEAALGLEVAREQRLGPRTIAIRAGADVEQREGLIGADDDRAGVLLEHLHGDAVATPVALEDELRASEVDV